jgi:hypothetical protein
VHLLPRLTGRVLKGYRCRHATSPPVRGPLRPSPPDRDLTRDTGERTITLRRLALERPMRTGYRDELNREAGGRLRKALGAKLRGMRQQQGLSLHDVEQK